MAFGVTALTTLWISAVITALIISAVSRRAQSQRVLSQRPFRAKAGQGLAKASATGQNDPSWWKTGGGRVRLLEVDYKSPRPIFILQFLVRAMRGIC